MYAKSFCRPNFTTLKSSIASPSLADQVAYQRPWPDDDSRTVEQVFTEEQPRLLPLPNTPVETDLVLPIHAGKPFTFVST